MKKYIINIKNVCFLVCLIISMSIDGQTIRTVGTSGNYTDLGTAFTAINNGTITGNIELQIISSYTVTSTATLNGSGSGSASYTSISIYPTGAGYTIQHNIAGIGIVLSGADNVTFDGRVNRTGSTRSLTIANTNTGTSAGVIRFINSAETNTIRWCNIRGAGPNSSAGMITFGTSTAGNGNDGNTIDNCDITTNAATLATRPRSAIYSLGSVGFTNDNITVSNCNIYNFHCNLAASSISTGISLANHSSGWTISGNSFYETAAWSGTPFSTVVCIQIGTSTTAVGSGYTITNNFMGGTSANCVGTWSISATAGTTNSNPQFTGMYIRAAASGVANSIQGNTIKNFNISTLQAQIFTGIYIYAGNDFNIGNTTGNTIQSITLQGRSSSPSTTCGFDFGTTSSAFGNIRIENNTIVDIPVTSSTNVSSSVYGIRFSGTSNTFLDLNINNNSIGGASGIYSTSAGTSTTGQVIAGIFLNSGNDANFNTTISGNTIWNLQNSATDFSSSQLHMIYGIYSDCRLTTGTNLITRNFIRSLIPNTTTKVEVRGISTSNLNPGNATYSNNIITIGAGVTVDCLMSGLWFTPSSSGQTPKIYHNTIYIGGGSTSNNTNPSYALWGNSNSSGVTGNDIRNNIFHNARSGQATSASKHYAIRIASSLYATTMYTLNYNDYFVSGTNGILALFGFSGIGDRTTLASWQAAPTSGTGQDANTLNVNPTFASAGGTLPANYLPSATVNGLSGISGAPTVDYFQNTRPSTPKMGALESSCNPPNGTVAFGSFTSVGSSSITVNVTYTNGTNLANGYVLLRNTTNTSPTAPTSGTAVPADGSTSFVSGYTVVGSTTTLGSSVAFVSSGLNASTAYYYWVIPYQNTGGPCWLTTATQTSNSQSTTTPPVCTPPNGTVAFGSFTSVTSTTTTTNVTYTNGPNTATGFILLRSTSASLPVAPSSGTTLPTAGNTTFVSGYTVVDVSTTIGSSVAFGNNSLNPSTTYYYFVMAYQNSNGPCYFTPGTQNNNSQATPCSAPLAPTGSSSQSFCSSANPAISSLSATGTSIQWYAASTGGTSLATSTALVNGSTYHATQTVASCESTSRLAVNVTITNNPVSVSIVSDDADNTICSGTSVTFTATPTNGGTTPSYQWKLNGGNVGTNSAIYSTSSLSNGDGVSVVLTSNITCPTGSPATSNTINTTINANPTANISPSSPSVCTGDDLSLNGTPSGGSGSYTHSWTGSGSGSISSTSVVNPIFNNNTANSYSINYTVTDGNGCVGSDVETIVVNTCPCIPPNGTVLFDPFTNISTTTTTANITYTNGINTANGYVLLRSTTSTPPIEPSSGTAVPSVGSTSFVVGYTVVDVSTTIGSQVSFVNIGLTSSTTYYYWVMSYQNLRGPCWFTPTPQSNNSQITSPIGLPIELISFTVKCVGNNDRLFEWKTASEYNNSYFTIESSKDFVNWNTIHIQSGAVNSTQLINYTLIKKSPYSSGVEYWRLRQTDFDGTSKITGSISIECRSDEYLVYFVNPIEDETIKGTIQSPIDSEATIELFTEIGQLVSKKELNIKAGANFVSIDDLDLSSAMYFVLLTIGDSVFIHKLIVIN